MRIKKLTLQNIRSYEELEIEFPRGSVLLSGEIGSGKTSILLGLQFALFGLQPGQKGLSILRRGCDSAYARIEIEIEGQTVNLERTIKKSRSGGITQDSNVITIAGQREELSTIEMKTKVMALLNYPQEFAKKANLLFKYTVYTPQEEMKQIIEERPEVRLDTIRHVFGIDRYKKIKENSAIFLQKLKDTIRIKEILVSELGLMKEKLKIEQENKIQLARIVNNLRIENKVWVDKKVGCERIVSENAEDIKVHKKLEQDILGLEISLREKKVLEDRLKKEMGIMQRDAAVVVDFSQERFVQSEALLRKHKKLLDERNSEYIEVNSQILAIETRKEVPMGIANKILSFEECPTCFQKVGPEHKERMKKRTNFELEDMNRELVEKVVRKKELVKQIEKEKELVGGYEKDFNEFGKNKIKYEHLQNIKTKIQSDAFILERTTNEIIDLGNKIEEKKTECVVFEKTEEKYEKAKAELREIDGALRRNEIKFAEKNRELELLVVKLQELSEELHKKEKIKEDLVYLRNLQDWLGNKFLAIISLTEKNVLSKLRTEFSKLFAQWFSMLVSDELLVRLDEDFTPIITNQDYEMDYDFLSGGERTSVALAYRLALNQVLNGVLSRIKTKDIVILDEPTDGFASEQIDKMRDIFEQLNSEQMILVSHEQKIEGFVDSVVRVKKGASSEIEKV